MNKLLYTVLLLTSTTISAQDYCALDCGSKSTCYVSDPTRSQAPWSNAYTSYPQCYDNKLYQCNSTVNFLCPIGAPYVCGRQCYTQPTTVCDDTYDYSNVQNGCPASTVPTTTILPTTVLPTSAAAIDTTTESPTKIISNNTSTTSCSLRLPSIDSLPSIPLNALRIQLNLQGSNILNDIVCIDTAYQTFVNALTNDLSNVLDTNNTNLYNVVTAINSITGLLTVIDLLANEITTTQSIHNRLQAKHILATINTANPVDELITLSQLTNQEISSTTYLRDARLSSIQVYCDGTNLVSIDQCTSLKATATTTPPSNSGTDSTVTGGNIISNNSGYNYVKSHLVWIIPAIVFGSIALLAIVILGNIYCTTDKIKPVVVTEQPIVDENVVTGQQIHVITQDNESIGSIPIHNNATPTHQLMYDKDILSPSSKRQLILVPENFLYDNNKSYLTTNSAHTTDSDISLYNDEISQHRVLDEEHNEV